MPQKFTQWIGKLSLAVVLGVFSFSSIGETPDITVIPVDTAKEQLALFLTDSEGFPIGTFYRLQAILAEQGKKLKFAMNAGMFHADLSPVGLYVENSKTRFELNQSSGQGNFFIEPNGVFLLSEKGPMVITSKLYANLTEKVLLATQSGPMLLINGKINPHFLPQSESKFIRNGVCAKGKVAYFVISNEKINLYEFAKFFRDKLACTNALYFDGNVSSLFLAGKRSDHRVKLGPIIAVTH